jgi:hypothetical protein
VDADLVVGERLYAPDDAGGSSAHGLDGTEIPAFHGAICSRPAAAAVTRRTT